MRQRRAAQLRGARAADGRLEGIGPGLAPRAGRDPQVHEAPVADGHARVRARRATPHHFPYIAAGHADDRRRRFAALATSELFDDAQRATLAALCDTFIPSLDPPDGDEPTRTGSGPAPPRTSACRRGSRSPCCRPGCADEQVAGLRDAARLAGRQRDGGGDPAGGARGDRARASASRAPRRWPGSPRCAASPRRSSTRCPISAPARNPNWDAIGYPGRGARRRPDAERPLTVTGRDRRATRRRGRRLRRGLGRRRRRDRRRARGRGQAGLRARDGRLPRRRATSTSSSSGRYQRLYLSGGPFPTAEGQVSIQSPARRSAAARSSTGPTACGPTPGSASEWAREHGLEGLDGADYDAPPRRGLGAARRQRRLLRPERPAPAHEGGLRGARLRLPARSPATPTRPPTTRASAGYMGFGDPSGSKHSTAKTYLADAQPRRRRLRRPLPRSSGSSSRTAARRASRRVYTDPATGATAAVDGPGADRRRGLRLARVAGPAAALRHRRPGRRRLPAPAPDGAVFAFYDEPQNSWWGPPQARSRTSSPTSATATAS